MLLPGVTNKTCSCKKDELIIPQTDAMRAELVVNSHKSNLQEVILELGFTTFNENFNQPLRSSCIWPWINSIVKVNEIIATCRRHSNLLTN